MIRDLFYHEQPRERCLAQGPESLSLRECLAVLLGTGPKGVGCLGLAASLFKDQNGASLSDQDFFGIFQGDLRYRLVSEPGLGPAGQARLLVAFDIARRYWLFKQTENAKSQHSISYDKLNSKLFAKIPMDFRHSINEKLAIIAQLSSGRLSPFIVLGAGDDTSVTVSTRKLLQTLIYIKAESFWLFHNHPNNILEASSADLTLTENLRALARIIGIPLNAHWIVSQDGQTLCGDGMFTG